MGNYADNVVLQTDPTNLIVTSTIHQMAALYPCCQHTGQL